MSASSSIAHDLYLFVFSHDLIQKRGKFFKIMLEASTASTLRSAAPDLHVLKTLISFFNPDMLQARNF
jgi:hypothetical protein